VNAELKEVRPQFVSFVPKGASRKPIQLWKSDSCPEGVGDLNSTVLPSQSDATREHLNDSGSKSFKAWLRDAVAAVKRAVLGSPKAPPGIEPALASLVTAIKGDDDMDKLTQLLKEAVDEVKVEATKDSAGAAAKLQTVIGALQELHRALSGGGKGGDGDDGEKKDKKDKKDKDAEGADGGTDGDTGDAKTAEKLADLQAKLDALTEKVSVSATKNADLAKEQEALTAKNAEQATRIKAQQHLIKTAALGASEPETDGGDPPPKPKAKGDEGDDPWADIDDRSRSSVAKRTEKKDGSERGRWD